MCLRRGEAVELAGWLYRRVGGGNGGGGSGGGCCCWGPQINSPSSAFQYSRTALSLAAAATNRFPPSHTHSLSWPQYLTVSRVLGLVASFSTLTLCSRDDRLSTAPKAHHELNEHQSSFVRKKETSQKSSLSSFLAINFFLNKLSIFRPSIPSTMFIHTSIYSIHLSVFGVHSSVKRLSVVDIEAVAGWWPVAGNCITYLDVLCVGFGACQTRKTMWILKVSRTNVYLSKQTTHTSARLLLDALQSTLVYIANSATHI